MLEIPHSPEVKSQAEQVGTYILSEFEKIDQKFEIGSWRVLQIIGVLETLGAVGVLGISVINSMSEGKDSQTIALEVAAGMAMSTMGSFWATLSSHKIKKATENSKLAKSQLLKPYLKSAYGE